MTFDDFQTKMHIWCKDVFKNKPEALFVHERNARFMEEALELVQSLGFSKEHVLKLVEYTYSRPIGIPTQEIGGVLTTLSALTASLNYDLGGCAQAALNYNHQPEVMERVRTKTVSKDLGISK